MKKYIYLFFLFCVFTLGCQQANAQFCVNGKHPVFDKSNNRYIISVPKQTFGNDYEAEIVSTADSGWKNIKIDNAAVEQKYIFRDIIANKNYMISALTSDGNSVEANITFTFLPVVEIKGNAGYEYTAGTMKLHLPDENDTDDICILLKWRGGSTNSEGRNKRNYKIKTTDRYGNNIDCSFLGMRKDNKWVLDAGQVDMFRMRNRIATDLWNSFAAKPYYAAMEPKAKNGNEGKITEVVVNNEYRGIYSLNEDMDRKELKLKKYNDNTIHGQLWKAKGYGYATFWDKPDVYDNNSETWNVFETKYPDIDDVCPTDYSILWQAVNFTATSDDDTFRQEVNQYFDIPVLIDYYIFLQIVNGIDNIGKNMYWAVYDKQTDRKLTLAVWDLDATVGQNYIDSPLHPDNVKYDNPLNVIGINFYYRLSQMNIDGFNDKLRDRYFSLRQNQLEENNIIQLYQSYYNLVATSGAAKREENKWSGNSDLAGNELNFYSEMEYIKEWISNRLAYTDSFFAKLGNNTGIHTIDNIYNNNTTRYDIYGRRSYGKGIYIMNGKKYLSR